MKNYYAKWFFYYHATFCFYKNPIFLHALVIKKRSIGTFFAWRFLPCRYKNLNELRRNLFFLYWKKCQKWLFFKKWAFFSIFFTFFHFFGSFFHFITVFIFSLFLQSFYNGRKFYQTQPPTFYNISMISFKNRSAWCFAWKRFFRFFFYLMQKRNKDRYKSSKTWSFFFTVFFFYFLFLLSFYYLLFNTW